MEKTKIAWCDSTWNSWIGCTKVSPGCKFCYAERLMDNRLGKAEWGPQGIRVRTSQSYWRKPVQWNKDPWWECPSCGWRGAYESHFNNCPICGGFPIPTRRRVFCASLADVFEDNPQLTDWRSELFMMIGQTPNLDWLILTKRPENILGMIPFFADGLPSNVWIGASVETPKYLDTRLSELLEVPASVHFLSVEPMLGPVRLPIGKLYPWAGVLDWVICGGESGPHARPMELQWARDLRDDCKASGTAFFMKQLGGRADKRDQLSDFPEDLQIREFPQ